MRCSSTVSAPVQHCCAPLTAHHSRYIAVQLLTNQVLYFVAETKSKAKDVYAQTCIYLAGQGMLDCELFGLAIMCAPGFFQRNFLRWLLTLPPGNRPSLVWPALFPVFVPALASFPAPTLPASAAPRPKPLPSEPARDMAARKLSWDGEYLFVDPECKLSKYAPKNWKSSSSHGLDGSGKPVFVLHFRVQYYVDTTLLLRDEMTRHSYYLQLRDNAISRGQVSFCSSDELLLLLAGFALQADFGDYSESEHKKNYFQPEKYFPKELISRNSHIFKMAIALHKDNHGLSTAEAELQYIKEASSPEITSLTYNVHLYRLKSHKKQEMDQTTVWLAICARGIQIYEETHLRKSLSTIFPWNNIGKLCFDRKKFEIKALSTSAEKLTYYTSSDEKSKHLLFLCRVTHQFSMTMQSRLSEVKKKEEEERKKLKDCFAYNRGFTSEFSSLAKVNLSSSRYKNMRSDQRISVISNTSSNTTSGIVSDRVQSLDESEDDLEMEIMINSPPGNSVESLALAHLRDGPSGEENEESEPSLPVSEDATDSILPGNQCTQKSSPSRSGGGAATPATTDGSQCSSSCSTVVITGVSCNSPAVTISLPAAKLQKSIPRRSSTTSSLELGYSHTAQNSVVSDSISCLELDLPVQNAQFAVSDKNENDCSKESEVYSLQAMNKSRTDVKTSGFLFNRTNEVDTNPSFNNECAASDIETTSSGVYTNPKSSTIYKRSLQSDLENTHPHENDYPNRMPIHLSNGSDLETTSSGVYTNSNDMDLSRIYSSADLENASSEIFTLRSATEQDSQTNACSSETSGVYLANSMADTSSASDCCGVYAIMESMRGRSGSNASRVSTSGSFHGDGSDPSEAGKGSLLTAKELSDLIVGKTHNSGSYPLRATISNTLDSDSDYVTLPPPPRPPLRLDSEFGEPVPLPERPPPPFPENISQTHSDGSKLKRPVSLQNLLPRQYFMTAQNILTRRQQFRDAETQRRLPLGNELPNKQQYSSSLTSLLAQIGPSSTLPSPTEEANARFITTKPHISMITHSNVPSASVAPNYASLTHANFALNYCDPNRMHNENPAYSSESVNAVYSSYEQNCRMYPPPGDISSNLSRISISQKSYFKNMDNTSHFSGNNFPLDSAAVQRFQNKNCQCDPGAKMKLSSVPVLPIVGTNNYLDIHASKGKNLLPVRSVAYHRGFSPLPPPVGIPRQPPPPPPPPPLATVYTSQVTRSQIEQFKQQLYSDVDYVIYPMKDPAISKQEYIDAKQGSLLAAMATGYPHLYPPPPPYPSSKTHVVYRSTPNVALGNGYLPVNFSSTPVANSCSSSVHLSQSNEQLYGCQTYLPQPSHYSSASPLYSPASYSSGSSLSLRYDPAQVTDYFMQHPLSGIPGNSINFSRTKSDDNILNFYQKPLNGSLERAKCRRFPPPPPPPPYETPQRTTYRPEAKIHHSMSMAESKVDVKLPERKKVSKPDEEKKAKVEQRKEQKKESPSSSLTKTITDDKGKIIDIHALIEKSKNLDLPLISALCNDKSLLRQTNAFVMPKHPGVGRSSSGHGLKTPKPLSRKITDKERPLSFHSESKNSAASEKPKKGTADFENSLINSNCSKPSKAGTLLENLFSGKSSKRYSSSSKFKYPVSGLSTTQISKPQRKLSSTHIHPKDTKLGQANAGGKVEQAQAKTNAAAIKSKDS